MNCYTYELIGTNSDGDILMDAARDSGTAVHRVREFIRNNAEFLREFPQAIVRIYCNGVPWRKVDANGTMKE